MTLVGYFNSLRELGGMRRLAEDDVQTRAYRVQMSRVTRPGLSQRSVKNVDELTSRVSNKGYSKKLDQLELSSSRMGERRGSAIDVVLATNMLSVGVDGQPTRADGRQWTAKEYGGVHPGNESRRSCLPRFGLHVLTWSRHAISLITRLSSTITRLSTSM